MKKQYDFGFNVSGLAEYINENNDLISKTIYNSQTLQLPGLQNIVGQKHDFKLTRVDHEVYFQTTACGWNTSGSTSFDNVLINIEPIMIQEELCPTDFDQKYLGTLSSKGSTPEDFPFEKFIIETKTKVMSSEIDKLAWQGDKASGTGNMVKADGYISKLSSDCVYASGAISTTPTTVANALGKVDAMVAGIDERIYDKEDLVLFTSIAEFKLITAAQVKDNSYNYNKDINGQTLETTIAGSNIKIKGMHGLRGSSVWILTLESNLIFGTDLLDETDYIDAWYEKKGRQVLLQTACKLGYGYEYDFMVVHNDPTV